MQPELERIELFANLSAASRAKVEAIAVDSAYGDGEIILLEGDRESPVFCVLQGTVRVFRTNLDGREQTLIHLVEGAAFNIPAVFSSQGAPASVMAVGPTRLLTIPQGAFRSLVREDPEIALAVLADFADKLYHLTTLAYDLSLRSVRGRLAQFLLAHAEVDTTSPVRWTHVEIAAQIGTVREVVSRTLRDFVRDGLIRIDRQRIVVLDRDALVREAES